MHVGSKICCCDCYLQFWGMCFLSWSRYVFVLMSQWGRGRLSVSLLWQNLARGHRFCGGWAYFTPCKYSPELIYIILSSHFYLAEISSVVPLTPSVKAWNCFYPCTLVFCAGSWQWGVSRPSWSWIIVAQSWECECTDEAEGVNQA